MSNPGLPREVLQDTIDVIEKYLKEGYYPPNFGGNKPAAISQAARELQIAYPSVRNRLEAAAKIGLAVDWTKFVELEIIPRDMPQAKPRVRMRATTTKSPDGPTYRVLAIGDLHDAPDLPDKSRFRWIGQYANEHKIPYIRQIGDWATIDSCSQYDSRATLTGREKPSYDQDIASLEISIAAMVQEFKDGYDPDRLVTLGNHENRAYQWEDNNPEVEGMFAIRIEQAFGRGGFRTVPYMGWDFIGGVGFIHVPAGIMGKPYGGEMPENTIANKAVFSLVYGHTHKRVMKRTPKIGPQRHITVLNLGCALPDGHLEHYIKGGQMTGWSYGVYDLLIQGGDIVSDRFISMQELEEAYG